LTFNIHIPTELLKPYIEAYCIVESQGDGADLSNRVVPDTSIVMSLRYRGKVHDAACEDKKNTLPSSAFSGLQKSLRVFDYAKNTGNILVVFKEAYASAFFKVPFHEIFGQIVPLDNVISHQSVSILEEQLAEASCNQERIAVIEKYLLAKLDDRKPDKLIFAAIQRIRLAKGVIKMKDLANSLNISQDPFEKRFRRVIGASPKQFSSTIRMKSIISCTQQQHSLATMALDAGYFDQPHFNKEFKLFTGQTPTVFFKAPSVLKINDFLQ